MTDLFKIKICGITTVDDGLLAAAAGADAVGLNFYPQSPRFVSRETASAICRELPTVVSRVGLFVNSLAGEVCGAFESLGLDFIQLHGDEPPEFLAALVPRPVLRAFRLGAAGLEPVTSYLDRCRALDCLPRAILLDACRAGQYGGTGEVADWFVARQYAIETDASSPDASSMFRPPLVLAGGLTPSNVAHAIREVRPAAVDTASGVESSPGIKDRAKLEEFVRAASEAFRQS